MFLQWWPYFFQASSHRGNTLVCGWWLQILWLFPRESNLRSILLFNRGGKRLPTSVACSLFTEGVHFCKEPENPQLNAIFNRIRCWKCTKISSKNECHPSINQLPFNIHPSIIHHLTCRYHPSNYPVLGSSKWCKKESSHCIMMFHISWGHIQIQPGLLSWRLGVGVGQWPVPTVFSRNFVALSKALGNRLFFGWGMVNHHGPCIWPYLCQGTEWRSGCGPCRFPWLFVDTLHRIRFVTRHKV